MAAAVARRVKPMELAGIVGKHPSQVYGWIKAGRLTKDDDGLVSVADGERVADESTKRGLAKHDSGMRDQIKEEQRVKDGQMAAWLAGKGKVSVGVVTSTETSLIELTGADGRQLVTSVETLDEQIRAARLKFVMPSEILELVSTQYEMNERPDLAASLRKWVLSHSELPGGVNAGAPRRAK